MTRPAKPPVRYAYAAVNAQGEIAVQSYRGMLALHSRWEDAHANCTNSQHVERVRVSIAKGTK